jgi:uncharacterized RmlC-like cupin family protein
LVTLGDSDVINARVGEKPVPLHLKDGEVRYTPGNFAHAAINESERPFHNITIELLKPSADTKTCTESCDSGGCIGATLNSPVVGCPVTTRRIASDQWTASFVTLPPSAQMEPRANAPARLVIAVSDLEFAGQTEAAGNNIKRAPGYVGWVPAGVTHKLVNIGSKPAQFVTLEFKPDKQNPGNEK